MKKAAFIALVLSALLLISCSGQGSGETQITTENTVDTTAPDEGEKAEFDFSRAQVSGYVFAEAGEVCRVYKDALGAEKYEVQKPDIASVSADGAVTVKTAGVSLVGYEKDGAACAFIICAFAEGEGPSRSADEVQIFEKGKQFILTPPIAVEEYTSSDEDVVSCESAPTLRFNKCGYAVVTAQNASRPFTYSFIVFER